MFATDISALSNSGLAAGRACCCQPDQQVSASDSNLFSQLMGQGGQNIQGHPPPPPPPFGDTESMDGLQQGSEHFPPPPPQAGQGADGMDMLAQNGHPPPPPQDVESSDALSDLSELSSSEDLMNMISQLLLTLQSINLSGLSGSDSSSLLGGSFSNSFSDSFGDSFNASFSDSFSDGGIFG